MMAQPVIPSRTVDGADPSLVPGGTARDRRQPSGLYEALSAHRKRYEARLSSAGGITQSHSPRPSSTAYSTGVARKP
jgi:hypothetical protein